jgi:DNA-directed RNA polymerase delta subunit
MKISPIPANVSVDGITASYVAVGAGAYASADVTEKVKGDVDDVDNDTDVSSENAELSVEANKKLESDDNDDDNCCCCSTSLPIAGSVDTERRDLLLQQSSLLPLGRLILL